MFEVIGQYAQMLIDLNDFKESLVCPISGQALIEISEECFSNSDKQHEYQVRNGLPVLVDRASSLFTTVLNAEHNLADSRREKKGFVKVLKSVTSPPGKITKNNISRLIQDLKSISPSPTVLIVGGGTIGAGMSELYEDPAIRLVGFDVYFSKNIQFLADAHNIPFRNHYFDCVIVQAVLEHVLDPPIVVSEIHRILKQGGLVYSETPFLQHVHEGAYDFTRYTDSGHRYLFRNFELIRSGVIAGTGTSLLWSIEAFTRGVFRSRIVGKIFKLLFFWIQYFDYMIPAEYSIDSANGFHFLGRRSDNEISKEEIISYYQGHQ